MIDQRPEEPASPAAKPAAAPGRGVRPSGATSRRALPWAVAAGFALLALWFGQRDATARMEADLLRDRERLADLALRGAQQQLEAERIVSHHRLADAQAQLATQNNEADLAHLKIATLASRLQRSPDARAVAVWNPADRVVLLHTENLPASTADQVYELWAMAGGKPVSAGVFKVDANGTVHREFPLAFAATGVTAFAISRERDDGATRHAAPTEIVLAAH